MPGVFLFEDLHVEIPVGTLKTTRILQLGIEMRCLETSAQYPLERGVVISPDKPRDRESRLFTDLMFSLNLIGEEGGVMIRRVDAQELFWQPADWDVISVAIAESMRSWDGQELADLLDDMARVGIACYLSRIAEVLGVDQFERSDGRVVSYEPYLAF